MSPQPAPLTSADIATTLRDLPGWRFRLDALHTVYKLPSSDAAVDLMYKVGLAANNLDHHPDLDWLYNLLFIRLSTHSAGRKVTANDVTLATRISQLAKELGATAVPEKFRTIEIGVDTADPDVIRDTWATLLDYKATPEGDLYDPAGRGPAVWFQKTDTPDASRLHLDVFVEDDIADDVLAATQVAGAQKGDDRFRPMFTVISDSDGNRFCICTMLGRDE